MERNHLADPDIVGKILFIWIFRKYDLFVRTGSSWLGIATGLQ